MLEPAIHGSELGFIDLLLVLLIVVHLSACWLHIGPRLCRHKLHCSSC